MASPSSIPLRQSDFAYGSVILRVPGSYHLAEDIVFHPNPDNDFMPTAQQLANGDYNPQAFQLGFFGAIVVESDNVHIEGRDFSIKQSPAFNLHQRFYAHIEFGNAPFIDNEGPVDFVEGDFVPTSYCSVRNMRLGLSSHHGIHGNQVSHLLLENLHFENFEVASFAFNVYRNSTFHNIAVGPNNHKVPVKAMFSAARFVRLAVDMITEHNLSPPGVELAGQALRAELQTRIDGVEDEVLATGKTGDELFSNPSGLVDGNFYGFMLKGGAGVAVNDLTTDPALLTASEQSALVWSEGNRLKDIRVQGIRGSVEQVVSLSTANGTPQTSGRYASGVQKDCFGAVLQIVLVTDPLTGEYRPNVVSRAQAFVAQHKEFLPPMLRDRVTISPAILQWMTMTTPGAKLADAMAAENLYYLYNGDAMHHVNKGGFGARIDLTRRSVMHNVFVDAPHNEGQEAGTVDKSTYEFSHPQQTQVGYQGATARGICFSACHSISCRNVKTNGATSLHGATAVGIDMMGGTKQVGPCRSGDVSRISAPDGQAYNMRGYIKMANEDDACEDDACEDWPPPTTPHHHHHCDDDYSSSFYSSSSSSSSSSDEECCTTSDSDDDDDSPCYHHPAAPSRPRPKHHHSSSYSKPQCPVWQPSPPPTPSSPTCTTACSPALPPTCTATPSCDGDSIVDVVIVEEVCSSVGGSRGKKSGGNNNKSVPYSSKVRVFIIVLVVLLFLAMFALYRRWRQRHSQRQAAAAGSLISK